MSFIIRQIAKRADGGDIIRTRTLPATEIIVGRGTDCDIQLADLGIMLRHARLTRLPDGIVAVEATGGIPLEIDGKFVNRADLRVADLPAISMASHRLSLSPGETPDSVGVTAERVIAPTDAADAAAETEIFSLRGTIPNRRVLAWTLAVLVLVGGLLAPLLTMAGRDTALPEAMVAEAGRPAAVGPRLQVVAEAPAIVHAGTQPDIVWSSGPLSSAHAGLANSCGACHQKAFEATPDSACIACHKPSALPAHAANNRLAVARGSPQGLQRVAAPFQHGLGLEAGRCASCHKEHEGPSGALMVSARFCADCHDGLSGRLADTKLRNVRSWEEHPQFSPTLVTQTGGPAPLLERLSLDEAPRERSGLIYPHELHLSRTNSVANMVRQQGLPGQDGALGCRYCHVPDSDGVRFKPIGMEANCSACHDLAFARDGGVLRTLPHGKPDQVAGIIRDFYLSQSLSPRPGVVRLSPDRKRPGVAEPLGRFSPAEARQQADAAINRIFDKQGLCADCHETSPTTGADGTRWTVAKVKLTNHYLPKGLFPHKRHDSYNGKTADAACLACHTGASTSRAATDVLLPKVAQCRDCHGSGNARTAVAASCDTCHGYHGPGSGTAAPTVIAGGGPPAGPPGTGGRPRDPGTG
ncbi:cytochrome c3 family protein, partial [Polymorphobacter sp.]|uniref:cytochrome c3 family protein n=1 Tax=Polymorphobacter sp. TaxID=1909290 RepID=UPI003F6F6FC6